MNKANPSPEKSSFLLYEKIRPNPRTVARAMARGWKNARGLRLASEAVFCSMGRMKTPFMAAIMICEISISTPKIIEFVRGVAIKWIRIASVVGVSGLVLLLFELNQLLEGVLVTVCTYIAGKY